VNHAEEFRAHAPSFSRSTRDRPRGGLLVFDQEIHLIGRKNSGAARV
jgi:hypothetical protein